MKKFIISAVAVALIVPQVAMAAWWNPISWFRKQPTKTTAQESPVKTATSTASEIENLQKRIDDLRKQQPVVVPVTATSVIKKKTEKPVLSADNSETIKDQVQAQVEATLKARMEQDALVAKQKADEQMRIDLANAQLAKQIADQAELNRIQAYQAKQEKLNAINKQIADLNAKYVVDFAKAGQSGSTVSFAEGEQRKVTNQYNIDYATLMAQYQQIQYSN